jgi:hypothetical protein
MGFQGARFVPPQLLRRQPAEPLDEAALDLPHVDRRIERSADIMKDVDTQDPALPRERVDGDLAHRRAIGEVVERPTPPLIPVVVDVRRGVEAGRGQRDAPAPGLFRQRAEVHHLVADAHSVRLEDDLLLRHVVFLRGEADQPMLNRPRRSLCRHAVQVGAG